MSHSFPHHRRGALAGLAAVGLLSPRPVRAGRPTSPLTIAARSPWLANAVAVTDDGTLFLGLPRWSADVATPSLVRVGQDGHLSPFPGNGWNNGTPQSDSKASFVSLNAVHIFDDGSLWVVDQGGPSPRSGAQKLVNLDTTSGAILRALRFDGAVLPPGAQMNDLRIHGRHIFVSDSGLGALIVHDLDSKRTLRRLSGHPLVRQTPGLSMRGHGGRLLADAEGRRPDVQCDVIEASADGRWLYWGAPTGPIRRLRTAALIDTTIDDATLAAHVETVAAIPTIGGTAMDSRGNLYIGDAERGRVSVLFAGGGRATLVEDDRLSSPDGMFIDRRRRLYIPAPQVERLPQYAGGTNRTRPPFLILSMPLPASLAGRPLGDAITGRGGTA